MTPSEIAFLTYAILSRMAYVVFVGVSLRREDQDQRYTRRFGRDAAFRRFRRTAAIVMNHDAFAFVVVCVATRGSLDLAVSSAVSIVAGAVLVVFGLGIKFWAARTLGGNAYYWHNFFDPDNARGFVATGPYRYVSSPMYTIGYLPTYGFALITRSLPGVIAAAFAHAAIIAFYLLVEKPHFQRLHAPNR